MTKTVPADVAAAIDRLTWTSVIEGQEHIAGSENRIAQAERNAASARLALDAAILKHLRNADEMKAALELQSSGGA